MIKTYLNEDCLCNCNLVTSLQSNEIDFFLLSGHNGRPIKMGGTTLLVLDNTSLDNT